jgi:predicted ABC-type transport system involved in lysophospholipase L1 biosynthesis ATPase subunit
LLLVTHNREMAAFTQRQYRLFEGRLHAAGPAG